VRPRVFENLLRCPQVKNHKERGQPRRGKEREETSGFGDRNLNILRPRVRSMPSAKLRGSRPVARASRGAADKQENHISVQLKSPRPAGSPLSSEHRVIVLIVHSSLLAARYCLVTRKAKWHNDTPREI